MLLLLAGTAEARQLAAALAAQGRPAIASLAGATRMPAPLALPTRVGGFGGEAGFRSFLAAEGISAILDATHPFAGAITARTARIASETGLPHALLLRPEWQPGPDDRWTMLDRPEDAAAHIPFGAVVFLATGRQSLPGFANMTGRRMICRQIDPPDAPFPHAGGTYLIGRAPFSVAGETRLFRRLGVDWLVVKNSGGAASWPKIEAARNLGLGVAMLRRPAPPPGLRTLADVAGALRWLERL